jgi:hypothetical protein
MGLDKIALIVTTEQVLIALIIMTCIASIETGFIGGLISKAGSLKNLLRIVFKSNNPTDNSSKK